jgi:Tat protein translocase TatB subunit
VSFGGIGGLELLVILVLALLVLGPTRLASSARTLGKLSRDLRKGTQAIPNFMEEMLGSTELEEEDEPEEAEPLPPPDTQPRRRKPSATAEPSPDPQDDARPGA